jgi:hypothetical protein
VSHSLFKLSICLIISGLLFQCVLAETTDTVILNFHDGTPDWQIWYGNEMESMGNFMPGIDVGPSGTYEIKRAWFYHGGDYEESGVPYNLYIVNRVGDDWGDPSVSEYFNLQSETTCNHCWEYNDINITVPGSSDESSTIGLFVQALGGIMTNANPKFWLDATSDFHHVGAVLWTTNYNDTARAQDRATHAVHEYMSDSGGGEVLVGMEIEGDFIVPTAEITFSTIKSLY